EMYGKDLIESSDLSSEIVEILDGTPPAGFFYEMFLDADGKKISKSVGAGLTIDEWLDYAPLEALAWFIFQNPQKARKFHAGVVPDTVDSWLEDRAAFGEADAEQTRRDNPTWFVEREKIEAGEGIGWASEVNYSLLLNLASALNTEDPRMVWNYVLDYDPAAEQDEELIDELLEGVFAYYRDQILPDKEYRAPSADLRPAVLEFRDFLADYEGEDAETIQDRAYEIGKESGASLGEWFSAMYRLLLGQDHGPRLGSLVEVFGVDATVEAIDERLHGEQGMGNGE
ncbi:MAG: lysine--tRNA ligase, partial [Bradymonadaceae bacterium]